MFKLFSSPSFEPEIDAKALQTILDEIVLRAFKKGLLKKAIMVGATTTINLDKQLVTRD